MRKNHSPGLALTPHSGLFFSCASFQPGKEKEGTKEKKLGTRTGETRARTLAAAPLPGLHTASRVCPLARRTKEQEERRRRGASCSYHTVCYLMGLVTFVWPSTCLSLLAPVVRDGTTLVRSIFALGCLVVLTQAFHVLVAYIHSTATRHLVVAPVLTIAQSLAACSSCSTTPAQRWTAIFESPSTVFMVATPVLCVATELAMVTEWRSSYALGSSRVWSWSVRCCTSGGSVRPLRIPVARGCCVRPLASR